MLLIFIPRYKYLFLPMTFNCLQFFWSVQSWLQSEMFLSIPINLVKKTTAAGLKVHMHKQNTVKDAVAPACSSCLSKREPYWEALSFMWVFYMYYVSTLHSFNFVFFSQIICFYDYSSNKIRKAQNLEFNARFFWGCISCSVWSTNY